MGSLCNQSSMTDVDFEIPPYKDLGQKEIINENKFIVKFKINDNSDYALMHKPIELEVIHVDTIDSTMPASRNYIDEGNHILLYIIQKFKHMGKEKEIENGQALLIGIYILQVLYQLI